MTNLDSILERPKWEGNPKKKAGGGGGVHVCIELIHCAVQ